MKKTIHKLLLVVHFYDNSACAQAHLPSIAYFRNNTVTPK